MAILTICLMFWTATNAASLQLEAFPVFWFTGTAFDESRSSEGGLGWGARVSGTAVRRDGLELLVFAEFNHLMRGSRSNYFHLDPRTVVEGERGPVIFIETVEHEYDISMLMVSPGVQLQYHGSRLRPHIELMAGMHRNRNTAGFNMIEYAGNSVFERSTIETYSDNSRGVHMGLGAGCQVVLWAVGDEASIMGCRELIFSMDGIYMYGGNTSTVLLRSVTQDDTGDIGFDVSEHSTSHLQFRVGMDFIF